MIYSRQTLSVSFVGSDMGRSVSGLAQIVSISGLKQNYKINRPHRPVSRSFILLRFLYLVAVTDCFSTVYDMEIDFKGKRVLVTGAGKGIGRSTAKALARYGAEVIALTRSQADLDLLVTEVPSIKPLCMDLSKTDDIRTAIENLGDIHLLVNNAGISKLDSFLDVKQEDFDNMFGVNVKAALFVAQAVSKRMVASGNGGSIVNVSSQASQVALQEHTLYCSTKAALDMLTKVMAMELGKHKIRVNSVNPTVVLTKMGRYAWSDKAKAAPMLNRIPLGKFAEEEDVVNAILFLLSEKASMINGVTLPVDGGFLVS